MKCQPTENCTECRKCKSDFQSGLEKKLVLFLKVAAGILITSSTVQTPQSLGMDSPCISFVALMHISVGWANCFRLQGAELQQGTCQLLQVFEVTWGVLG